MSDEPRDSDADQEHESPLDVEAEFAKIVDAYGDQPADTSPPATPQGLAERFQSHGWTEVPLPTADDPLNSPAAWDDEGHFVPPEPPPVHLPEGPRLAAWAGLLGAPVLFLVLFVLGIRAGWIVFLLFAAFVGGLGYLVATMRRDNDTWPGDDGAVL